MLQFVIVLGALVAAALAAMALFNVAASRTAARANPPLGRFLEVNGCRLHYIDKGRGDTLVCARQRRNVAGLHRKRPA